MDNDSRPFDATDLVGRRIDDVASSCYVDQQTGATTLVHAWLHVHGVGYVQCHAHSGVMLTVEQPYKPYEMPELKGNVDVVPGAPASLGALAGGTVERVRRLQAQAEGFDLGYVIETTAGSAAIADLGDQLTIGVWPDAERWSATGVALAR